jgi:hypothetical protein
MAQQAQSSKKSSTAKKSKAVAAKSAAAKKQLSELTDEDRFRMIAETAYLKAEQRGFQGEQAMEDWLQAEAEVDAQFASRH